MPDKHSNLISIVAAALIRGKLITHRTGLKFGKKCCFGKPKINDYEKISNGGALKVINLLRMKKKFQKSLISDFEV